MTTITNLFSNLNDLTKSKSVTDGASEYKDKVFDSSSLTPALNQGEKFKNYQKKIKKNLEKNANKLSGKEGFDGLNLNNMNIGAHGLTRESNNIIKQNNFSSDKQTLTNLKDQYKNTLNKFETLMSQISGSSTAYINRVSSSNPYLGKNVRFSDGAVCYVTQQGVAKWYENETIFQATAGQNGCPSSANLVQLEIPFAPYKVKGTTIPTTPKLITGTPMTQSQSCGNEGSNIYVNSLTNNTDASYTGCYNTPSSMTTTEELTFAQCQTMALNTGNQYFGLQGVNSSGVGMCVISNNLTQAESGGVGYNYSLTPLWASNTASSETSNPGASATVSLSGSLSVLNSNGSAVYNSPSTNATPPNYLGCYGDGPNRAIPLMNTDGTLSTVWGGNEWSINYSTAFTIANNYGYKYFSVQCANGQGYGQGGFTNDLEQAMSYGAAANCQNIGSYIVGGGWSNAIYSANGTSQYYLVCQDDGNLVMYRGSGPGDNQGVIWATGTNGKQLSPNPNYTASKGAGNVLSVNENLLPGGFIGNTDGSIFLLMQNDGNLVLYTSTQTSGCSTSSAANNNYVGSDNINSLYQINQMGNMADYGQVAYVDQNSTLHPYPQNNIEYGNTYTSIEGVDSPGNDIPGAAYSGTTLSNCQATCGTTADCAGLVFDASNKSCFPKTSGIYPNTNMPFNSNLNVYVRNQVPIKTPIGVSNNINNIDSVLYTNYLNGGAPKKEYGLANATSVQKQQLEQLQDQLNMLSSQITTYTNQFGEGSQEAEVQMNKNVKGVGNYLKNLNKANKQINGFNTHIDRILDDSDIVALQKNYDYLFWSILAAGTVLVTMNIAKQ